VMVVIDQPEGVYYGGQIAAPVFSQVMGQVLVHADVPPDPALAGERPVPDLTGKSLDKALSSLRKVGLRARVIGSGERVSNQFPVPGTPLENGSQVLVFAGSGQTSVVPNVLGKDVREALALLDRANLRADLTGVGRVVDQQPQAGEEIPTGGVVRIRARPSTPPQGES